MLASASDAIIIGFNVRPANARQLADKEEIDIRYYSIIYAAIDDLKDAMEGMLAPDEEVLGTAEIRDI
jgi:translation initiation factor IF-2